MKITQRERPAFFAGPSFVIPPNSARMSLTLRPSSRTNLTPISRAQFER
jgi:hypothetical protein